MNENVKDLFNKEKSNLAKIFTMKWIASIIVIVSLIALTFIPFIKFNALKAFSKKNDLGLTKNQISRIEDIFDATQEEYDKFLKEAKKELSKEEYDLLTEDKTLAFVAMDWSKITVIIEENMADEKKPYALTEEKQKEMVEAYLVSKSTYSLFNILFSDEYNVYYSDGLQSTGSNDSSYMYGIYYGALKKVGKIFVLASLALAIVFAGINIFKFTKKKESDYIFYFDKNVMVKPKGKAAPDNYVISGSVMFGIYSIAVTILASLANGYTFGVGWPVIFIVIFLAGLIGSIVYPAMKVSQMRTRVTKEKYNIE